MVIITEISVFDGAEFIDTMYLSCEVKTDFFNFEFNLN